MACVWVDNNEIPLVFWVLDGGRAKVFNHLLHVYFRFVESSIYIEEERKSKLGELQESIPKARCREEDGHCWYLPTGNYRAFKLPLPKLTTSIEILNWQSTRSTVDIPYNANALSPSSLHDVLSILPIGVFVHPLKVEKLDPFIELSSKSKGESPDLRLHRIPCSNQTTSYTKATNCNTPLNNPLQSLFSCLPLPPYLIDRVNIMECLRRLATMHLLDMNCYQWIWQPWSTNVCSFFFYYSTAMLFLNCLHASHLHLHQLLRTWREWTSVTTITLGAS